MISIRKLVLYSGISIALVVLVWILFSSEDPSEKEKKSKEANSVALLLGGGGSSSSSSSGGKTNESIFDSSFYKAGKGEYIEAENGGSKEADPDAADADNPINPQTNKPYTNEEMERFSQLRERFPNNSLVPKKLSPAEKEAKKQEDNQVAEAARNVYAKTASPTQIRLYYNHMEKQTLDRMDIINYLVDLQKGSGDEETEKKLENIQDSIKNQLQQVQKDKENAFKQAGL
ncbi:LIC_20245 family lipoprotein [Leptospira santarosai]|uniref:Uncharacterized protein n=1 Tax=Leptospira santarosai serovar Shermani str. LT 821 TaxID=758847 RepID=K8YE46_9LEPT|nr:hypothetical protein [Leptospira santarosai]EKS09995.1 hypothetical protein LEP1GSC071_0558 [Leptospira santarosai str. JET]EKT88562.1 hypothetical protein LSS_02032 [Leptospira santarosai serovar Shermani str. LT 821]EMM88130.1 hypothetical protein LEP1GSC039_3467 [Leptospira santarosai str. 2000027870]EMO31019.1 hypothetical protein LEP1GSC175_3868 [Leptospira santarosai str. HAI821]EPG82259.1 hypothetical protein LEP1GSC048_0750 [Leptospira santarosai serovar Shermani str. 1342KT]